MSTIVAHNVVWCVFCLFICWLRLADCVGCCKSYVVGWNELLRYWFVVVSRMSFGCARDIARVGFLLRIVEFAFVWNSCVSCIKFSSVLYACLA